MIIGTRVLGSHLMVGSVEPMMMGDCIDMEEGEASCHHKDNGGDIDPDITLSYIDEKIERFLGHFQKDFEGGVSAEKLGAKYGGYGSFLPTYERTSSILPHNLNQQRDCNAAPTPVNLPLEGSSQNPKASPTKRPEAFVCNTISSNKTRETFGSNSGRSDSCLPATKVTNSCPSKDEASGRLGSPMNGGSLKFRIKVGSDSVGLKNAAIYSGLGLDDSPLSSSLNSSDLSEGMLPLSQGPPDESPSKIIQAMTSFPVPHGALISPLHDSLLGLSKKEKLLPLPKPVPSLEKKKDGLAKLANETTLKQNDSTLVKKKKKEVVHRERQVNLKNEVHASRGEEKTTLTLVKRKLDNEAFESKEFLSNELQCKPASEVTKSSAYLDSQKKLSHKATLQETVKHKASIKKEKPEIVGEKKIKVVQTAGGKIAGSIEGGFKIRSEASRGRKNTDSDTPESENRRHRLKLHSNEKVGANNMDSFNSSGLDVNRISKDATERASVDFQKVKGLDDSGIKMSKCSKVVEPAGVAPMDEWVCCDICQKWRLLPFGTKPEQLPDKWLCSMLDWLPGMNRCDISEEETTEKLYALYQLPLPQSGNALQNHANGLISADTSNQGKKKETLKEIQNPVSRIDQTHGKSSLKDQQLESRKNKSLNGLSNPPSKLRNSMDQSSGDLNNLAEGKNRVKLKEKSTDRVNCDQLKRKNKRPEEMRFVDNHQNFNMDVGKMGCSSNSGLTNMEGGEGLLKQGDIGSKKHNKLNTENKMQISLKKRGGTAEISSVNQPSGKSACTKKRKLNDWQDDQNSPNSGVHESVLLKEENCEKLKKRKKLDVSNNFTDGMEEISKDKEAKMQIKKIIAKQTSVRKELPKRNLVARQVSAVANSSSSNVSQSHLTKAKFVVKVSPAESVSSSPMRSSGLDQFGGEKEEITSNIHPNSHALNTNSKKIKASPVVQHHFVVTSGANAVKQPRLCNNRIDDGMEPSHKKHKKEKINVGIEGLETPQNLKGNDAENQRSDALFQSNKAVRLASKRNQDFEAGNKGDLRTVEKKDGKVEPSRPGADPLRVSIRAGDSHQLNADAPSDDVVESKKTPDRSRDVNASNINRMKSSNQTASDTLKDAKKLREEADHLKNSGFTFESNELYFQSALKYLHGAFLLETLDNTSGKPGDISPIRLYSTTAELCESCALEYERRQEMAAASLAFKCIEVAYLRIVYHKHSSINGDRLEMNSLFRSIVQGESPSSSASDVDNLSNHGAMDKATFDRGSTHGARSQIWNAGTCTSFGRVLNFARDMNSAMEASKNSRNAFLAASSCASEGKHVDYVASVKKVIDFSFQDVGELVQLVRVATQMITHSGFCSGRD